MHYINAASPVTVSNVAISLDSVANPPKKTITAATPGTATITPTVGPQGGGSFDFNSSLTLNVILTHTTNGQGGPQVTTSTFRRTVMLQQGGAVIPASYAFDIPVEADDTLSFYYTTSDAALPAKPITAGAVVRTTSPVSILDVPSALHSHVIPKAFSKPYRGWGSIAYNGNRVRADEPIHQELLVVSDRQEDYDLTDTSQASSTPRDIYLAIPEAPQDRWISADERWWIKADVMSSSRLGLDYISVPRADNFNGAVAVPRITQSSSDSVGVGYYVAISATQSPSEGILDYFDMNGDRFPDVVGGGLVQYSSMVGTLEGGVKSRLRFGPLHEYRVSNAGSRRNCSGPY